MVEPWGDAFYFAHSYAATCPDSVATSEGVTVAVERGAFLAYNSTPKRAGRPVWPFSSDASRPFDPCLDVAHGRVVKGVNFVGLRDVGDPVELAKFYSDGGADELSFSTSRRRPKTARR